MSDGSQAERSLPSKSTIASDGGLPFSPGVTIGGSGHSMPGKYSRFMATTTAAADNISPPTAANAAKIRRDRMEKCSWL